MDGVRIAWLIVDAPELLPEIEAALIEWFNPPLNGYQPERETVEHKGIFLYLEEQLKIELEALAKARKGSLSNLIEVLCQEAVDRAKQQGEIK